MHHSFTRFFSVHARRTLLAVAFSVSTALGLAKPVKFDIPAQPASSALQTFGRQAGVEVVYPAAELKKRQTPELKGEMEPMAALEKLFAGTDYVVTQTGQNSFRVASPAGDKKGTLDGAVRDESGKPVAGAKVSLVGSEMSVTTDRRGRFQFEEMPAGVSELQITAAGFQNTKVTDVSVAPGYRRTLSPIVVPGKTEGVMQLETYTISAKKNDGVIELDPYAVEGRREKPFSAGNMDIPRTINDAQPYYIFDAKTIDQSGAVNVEDFLKQRLTMNSVAQTNSQSPGSLNSPDTSGSASTISLRGLGADSTLVLVNGRRTAGLTQSGTSTGQADLNGIPLSAIERIEVLPSSASGIYGGNAVGGVVNVILKQNCIGGEIRTNYENTFDTDAPRYGASLTYGAGLEDGRTTVMISAAFSDGRALLAQDRRELFDRGVAEILKNSPNYIYSATNPFLGALPNIVSSTSSATTLTLKNGTVIPARITFVPAGTSGATSQATLYAGLIANAGQWNFDLPASTQAPTGLLRPIESMPETRAFSASIRRQFLPQLDLFADFSYRSNRDEKQYNPNASFFTVPASSPANPFNGSVRVRVVDPTQFPLPTESEAQTLTVGALAKLPSGWTAEFDYTRSKSEYAYSYYSTDTAAQAADVNSGALNPFVDSAAFPLALAKYSVANDYRGLTSLDDFSLRGSGPLPALPSGNPNLTVGLERRISSTPENTLERSFAINTVNSYRYEFLSRRDVTDSAYAEVTVPLIKPDARPLLHALEFQASGRAERFEVDTGTSYKLAYYNQTPPFEFYDLATADGLPFREKTSYVSTNATFGLKYQPARDLTLRASYGTAFLPPSPSQLVRNPFVDSFPSEVFDPRKQVFIQVETISGGNPDTKPQNSENLNGGVIWEPRDSPLEGLRVSIEYFQIKQFDAISYPFAQQIVDQESRFPNRVTRNASGDITQVDITNINLFKNETDGWDFSASYRRSTRLGFISASVAGTIISRLKTQYSESDPAYDALGFPSEAGAAKIKSNATLTWERGSWTAGWTARYFGSYQQFGAAGGPSSVQYAGGAVYSTTVAAQGGETIPKQIYHDAVLSYAFGKKLHQSEAKRNLLGKALTATTIQLGVKNVFNEAPPFDAGFSFYTSPYGDRRLRGYQITVRKEF